MDDFIEGKSRLRKREPSWQSIKPEQVETFFAELADSCNVKRSARTAGISKAWLYERRTRDAEFRRRWAAAVREGYAKLELVLLERAMKGTPKLVRTSKGDDRVMREYSTALAVALLRRHAETADSADYHPGEDQLREVRERILEKLERLKEREEAERGGRGEDGPLSPLAPDQVRSESPSPPEGGEGPIETKAVRDRVGLIVWALRRAA